MFFLAPAKLNLFLHIVGRRTDGYHRLQTAFQFLDYGDTLTFHIRQDNNIIVHSDTDIPLEHNLIYKAARCLQAYTHTQLGVDITLTKKIPIGGGLGGGSSNAATTLLALNTLWKIEAPIETLATLALQLGADVPVFIKGRASWAEGIGEELTAIDYPEHWYIILIPACSVQTAAMYAHPALTRNTPPIQKVTSLALLESLGNDFEPLARKLYPAIDTALHWLEKQVPHGYARLTGSGSAVFARCEDQDAAMQVLHNKPPLWQGFIAKSLNSAGI